MGRMVRVEGSGNWWKDVETGAVINRDTTEIKRALLRREAKAKQKVEQEQLKADVSQLKNDMNQIKELLTKLVEK